MTKIIILANNDLGLYKFRKELIEELINQGNKVYISLPFGPLVKPLTDMGCEYFKTEIDRRGLNPFRDLKLLINYLRMLWKIKPDKVITYTVKPNVYGGIISRLFKAQYYINITGLGTAFQNEGILKKLIVTLYKISCKRAEVVFFENVENEKMFIDNQIIKKEQAYRLNGAGVNLREYQFCEYPKDNGEVRFLFIGRVMKEKGINELLDVAKRIRNEYKNVEFEVVGPLEDDYKELIKELEDQSIIIYYGFKSDVKPFIRNTHCFVLPSYHEGMANTLLESGAMGRPLITSNIHGCKEAILDGKSGFVVMPKDSNDLYIKIKRFIELSDQEKKEMGKHSHDFIAKNFDKKLIVKQTISKIM